MKLSQELNEIKQKDLSKLSIEELNNYKTYLKNFINDAEKKSKLNLWKKMYNILGGIFSIGAGILMIYGVFSINRTLSIGKFLLCYGVGTILLIGTFIFNKMLKKATKNCDQIKQVCHSKISDVNNLLLNNTIKNEQVVSTNEN